MFVILVPLAFVLLCLLVYRDLEPRLDSMTGAISILFSAVVLGIWITLSTEILSLFQTLTRPTVVVSWLILIVALLALLLAGRKLRLPPWPIAALSDRQKLILVSVVVIVLVTGLAGLLSAPNNWDSMSYHLSRVMHWMQDRSVAHYATHELRQLYQTPWSEFFITHLYLLYGTDRFAYVVQWLSMIGSVMGAGILAGLLGGSKDSQLLAGLVAVTIPMGILQAMSTQTDYVVAFWLVCFVIFALLAMRHPGGWYFFTMGGSLGLAVFTKSTAYIYTAPFLLWFGLYFLSHYRWQIWKPVVVVSLLLIAINAGHFFRNFQMFGNPLQPELGQFNYVNQLFTPAAFVSNLSRNLALHVNTPVLGLSSLVERAISTLHRSLYLDSNDFRTTYASLPFNLDADSFSVHEDISGNFVHALLLFFSLSVLLVQSARRKFDDVNIYMGMLLLAGLLFVIYLKWQPWHSRLHLPLFVLSAPVISLILTRITKPGVVLIVSLILVVQALPFLLYNPNHPLAGHKNIFTLTRTEEYFLNRAPLMEPYLAAVQQIRSSGCTRVGLVMPGDGWEYPFWVLLSPSQPGQIQLRSIEPDPYTSIAAVKDFIPCAVICLSCQPKQVAHYSEELGPPRLVIKTNALFLN